jgi:hypothetical protein
LFLATRDLRVVLPQRIYGLDVTLHVGERHLAEGVALAQITRDLNARGVPLDQRHTGRVFRDFMALASLARGDDVALRRRLEKQGGIVLMCDGVQFEERSPVLYMIWDALSGEPLFGERKPFRAESDLVPLLEQVRDMGIPVIGMVTDKEKGLVPAVQHVFPDLPYQFCQTHFLKNCAKPLKDDAQKVATSGRRRAEGVHKLHKRLSAQNAEQGSAEAELAREVCEMVRVNSRVTGKAPLDPPELKRHARLEDIRSLVNEARQKGGSPRRRRAGGRSSTSSVMRSSRPGTKRALWGGCAATPISFATLLTTCRTSPIGSTGQRQRPKHRPVSRSS